MVNADVSDSDKDLSPLARANSENPWGPKRSVGSFTSGVSGRARGDSSPRLRGAYAEIQIKVTTGILPKLETSAALCILKLPKCLREVLCIHHSCSVCSQPRCMLMFL